MSDTRHAGGAPDRDAVGHHALQRVDLRRMDVPKAGELRRAAALDVATGQAFALASEALDQGRADPDAHGLADPSDLAGAFAPESLQTDIFDRAPFRLAILGAAIFFNIAPLRRASLREKVG